MVDVDDLKRKLDERQHPEQAPQERVVNHGAVLAALIGVVVVLAVIMVIALFITPKQNSGKQQACFKHDVCIELIVAVTPEEQEIGLSNYSSLPEGKGMLFIFRQADLQNMWMKDMQFPIDIIWISSNGKILHIVKNAQPCSSSEIQCEIFEPAVSAKYVLEAYAGFANDNNLFDSDKVTFENLPNVR